jgi:ABC-type transport system involved in multi-copper enzyme maturation permease subunit
MNQPRHLPGFLPTVLTACRQTLRAHLQWRLGLWVGLFAAILFGVAALLAERAHESLDGRSLFLLLSWWIGGTVMVPWGTMYLGVQAVHGPLEDRTYLYEFLRPVPRSALLLGKWLGVSLLAAGGAALLAGGLFAGAATNPDRWGDGLEWDLLGTIVVLFLLAALAYAAVAAWFSALFRRPLAWGTFFVVGLQMLTANLPVSAGLRQLTITDPLRRFVLDAVNPDQRLARGLWPAERAFQSDLVGEPIQDLVVLTAVCLLLAVWWYTRTEFDARNRE